MTPIDDPQSSEELPTSEENNIVPPIRVRNVAELNNNDENEAEVAPSTAVPVKRRILPSWMLTGAGASASKKPKQQSDVENSQIPESTVTSSPSTSRAHVVADAGESSNQNNVETSCDEIAKVASEVKIENGANEESASESNCDVEGTGIKSSGNEKNCPTDGVQNEAEAEADTGDIASTSNQTSASPMVTVKTEPQDSDGTPTVGQITATTTKDIKPAIKVEKEEATSSTVRNSCKFGIRCYRQNPMHRREEAHPGDSDYRRPDFPPAPVDAPPCPYGDLCYRRNPVHFQQFTHPPSS